MPQADCNNHASRLSVVEASLGRIEDAISQIAETMHMLTRLETQHEATAQAVGRVFDKTDNLEARIEAIEVVMPGLKETRSWIVSGVIGVMGLLGVSVLGLVLVAPKL